MHNPKNENKKKEYAHPCFTHAVAWGLSLSWGYFMPGSGQKPFLQCATEHAQSSHKRKQRAHQQVNFQGLQGSCASRSSCVCYAFTGSGAVTCSIDRPFPQGRVTDHRVGVTEHGIEGVMDGSRLHVFVDALHAQHQEMQLEMLDV